MVSEQFETETARQRHKIEVLDAVSMISLSDERIAISGDWHANVGWVRALATGIRRLDPAVTTILQAGDWSFEDTASDEILSSRGIERVFVTLGNHEAWGILTPLLESHAGLAIQVSPVYWVLPRPFRFTIGGRTFLSLGGAASIDRRLRTQGVDWWLDEEITDDHVDGSMAGGRADVMITHESPDNTPVSAVRDVLSANPLGIPQHAQTISAESRARVTKVWDAVRPGILFHGHMHAPGSGGTVDGRRVTSLGRDAQEGNLAFLRLDSLKIETPTLQEIRGGVW